MELAILIIKGIIIGLLASIPLGPIGVICIQRTLNKGKISGFVSGLGAATADTIFSAIAGFSLTFIIAFIQKQQIIFQAIGGVVVFILGIKIFYTNPIKQLRRHKRKKNNMMEDFLSVFIVTFTNPLAVFFFIALYAAFGIVTDGSRWFHALLTTSGVFVGAGLWWYTLTSTIFRFRDKVRLKQLWWINKIAGAVIATLGALAIIGLVRLFIT